MYFLKLGTTGFGGPVALVGYMQKDLVEDKRWITEEEYGRGLALAQLAPGPLAAQLAMYLGYIRGKILGSALVAFAFIIPSFIMVVILGMLYMEYGGLPWMQAVYIGISAAVIGIIVRSGYKLVKMTLKKSWFLWMIFIVMCDVTAFAEEEIWWLFFLCGALAIFVLAPPKRKSISAAAIFLPAGITLSGIADSLLFKIFIFFAKAGAFIFGSGLAIVPFLYGGVVRDYHWLTERQFIDAVAVAMITPGPVVITVGFIGYLVAAFPGAVMAAAGVFLPVYLFVIIPAPYFERFAKNPQLNAFVDGVTSAATGAIAGAVIVLGRRAIIDIPTAVLAIATLLILFRFKIPEPLIVLAAGLIGLALYGGYIF